MRTIGVLLAALAITASAAATPGYRIDESYPTPSGYTPGTTKVLAANGTCSGFGGTGFSVRLYDEVRENLWVCSHGLLEWGASGGFSAKTCALPTNVSLDPTLMPYWTTLMTHSIVGSNYGVFTKTEGAAPNRRFIVEWRQFRTSDNANRNFEVILYENSPILTVIYSGFVGGTDAAVGVQASPTGQATTWSKCGATAITSGLRLDFVPDPLLTLRPQITGQPAAGVPSNGNRGTWEGTEPMAFVYQWRRCDPVVTTSCVNIQGANELTYTPSSVEVNQRLR
ncbi:MAG: hypothetical protein WD428_00335, partial [Gaiellaceae bacterium]